MKLCGWVRNLISIFGLFLCLLLIFFTATGAVQPTATSNNNPAATANGKPPAIQLFKATPMVLDTPSSSAVYTFKVKNATNVHINEAGTDIKNINNPSGAALSGTATGLPASTIPVDDSGHFKTVLTAMNRHGSVQAELTLSLSEKLLASRLTGEETERKEANGPVPRSPKWLEQYSSPFSPARSQISGTEPRFFKCPSDCQNCLKPEEAKSQGMGERCSSERCYYSPNNQQNWYCFKPVPGWCCANLQVSQATLAECTKMGGAWFLNQKEALDRCLPMGYCCRAGNIYQATRSQCLQAGDTYYDSAIEAKERCLPPCFCCLRGQVFQTTQSQCAQAGGNCYTTQAEALRYCQQQAACWCCAQGKVFQTTQPQCAQAGGNCYTTQAEALRYCQQQAACWCCAQGKVFPTTQAQCAQSGGTCYATQSQATSACYPPTRLK